uniref:Uncharacterized protein n=1 Tax=Anguilla anguilla TaxID=7936 RepID=A0A0E9Q6J5_ANGAN
MDPLIFRFDRGCVPNSQAVKFSVGLHPPQPPSFLPPSLPPSLCPSLPLL